jgi:hypothetical protein
MRGSPGICNPGTQPPALELPFPMSLAPSLPCLVLELLFPMTLAPPPCIGTSLSNVPIPVYRGLYWNCSFQCPLLLSLLRTCSGAPLAIYWNCSFQCLYRNRSPGDNALYQNLFPMSALSQRYLLIQNQRANTDRSIIKELDPCGKLQNL